MYMKTSRHSVSSAGRAWGSSTLRRMRKLPAPSMRPASISARGVVRKNARIQNVPSVTDWPICGRISVQYVPVRCTSWKS